MKLSTLALPQEHGAWGFFLEASLLGLLLGYSSSAAFLFCASLAIFLSYQPFKLLLLRLKFHQPWDDDGARAVAVLIAYGILFAAFLWFSKVCHRSTIWIWFAAGIPFGLFQIFYSWRQKLRSVQAELMGALGLSLVAPILLSASGWGFQQGLLIWCLLSLRIFPSVFYVRTIIRRSKSMPTSSGFSIFLHVLSLTALGILFLRGKISWIVPTAFGSIFIWVLISLQNRKPVSPKTLGWRQVVAGLLYVGSIVLGLKF